MAKTRPAAVAQDPRACHVEPLIVGARDEGAVIIDLDDVAARRERLDAYAQATRAVNVYRFLIPRDALVAPSHADGASRDALRQLEMVVGLTGGALAKAQGGLAARIPRSLADKFEALARPLIAAYLVSLELAPDAESPNAP